MTGSSGPIGGAVARLLADAGASYDAPAFLVDGWVSTYTAIANGEVASVSSDVERLTGHPARTLEQYFADHPETLQYLAS